MTHTERQAMDPEVSAARRGDEHPNHQASRTAPLFALGGALVVVGVLVAVAALQLSEAAFVSRPAEDPSAAIPGVLVAFFGLCVIAFAWWNHTGRQISWPTASHHMHVAVVVGVVVLVFIVVVSTFLLLPPNGGQGPRPPPTAETFSA